MYPDLVGLLNRIEALMMVLPVEDDARFLGGENWLHTTPEDRSPVLYVYFTYRAGRIRLEAVHAEE